MNNEPVAWWDGKEPNVLGLAYHQNDYCPIPLYTHPVKEYFEDEPQAEELHEIMQSSVELTDEEILAISNENYIENKGGDIEFARAILRKAQEKDKKESLGTVNIGGVHYRNGKKVK